MQPTSFDYRIPETDDKDWWASYNYNWNRMNDHRHDGADSVKLAPHAIITTELEITAGTWTSGSPHPVYEYQNIVAVPLGWGMPDWTAGRPPLFFKVTDINGLELFNETGPGTGQQIIVYSPFAPAVSMYLLF